MVTRIVIALPIVRRVEPVTTVGSSAGAAIPDKAAGGLVVGLAVLGAAVWTSASHCSGEK